MQLSISLSSPSTTLRRLLPSRLLLVVHQRTLSLMSPRLHLRLTPHLLLLASPRLHLRLTPHLLLLHLRPTLLLRLHLLRPLLRPLLLLLSRPLPQSPTPHLLQWRFRTRS